MKRRRTMTIPVLSMLDLLFGVFGSLIVLAAIISSSISAQPEVKADEKMLFAAVELHTAEGTSVDLSTLFVSFELVGPGGVRQERWSPRRFVKGTNYAAASSRDSTSASLLLSKEFVAGLIDGRLRASLQNLPSIDGLDRLATGPAQLVVSVAIKMGTKSCTATSKLISFGELADEDADPRRGFGPDLFRIFEEAPVDRTCFRTGTGKAMFDLEGGSIAVSQP